MLLIKYVVIVLYAIEMRQDSEIRISENMVYAIQI